MQLLVVLFLLVSVVLGQYSMLLAGNIITRFVAPVHQCFAACQPGDVHCISDCVGFQRVCSQQVDSTSSCITTTCSLRDSPSALANYHLCQQSCMKSVRNDNNGTFSGGGRIVARNLWSDTRTREVNETLTCIVKFLDHPDRWSSEPISQFRQCVKPFRENLTEPLSSAVNHFLDASEPLEEVHGQSSVSSKHRPGAVVATVAMAVGTVMML